MSAYLTAALIGTGSINPLILGQPQDTIAGTSVLVINLIAFKPTFISLVGAHCNVQGVWRLSIDGAETLRGGTAPGQPNSYLTLPVELPVPNGAVIAVTFTARSGSIPTEVFATLVARTAA